MDYIGSKIKLNDWLFEHIVASVPPKRNAVLLDACSGSGAVSRHAAKLGYNVISNDIMAFPGAITNGSIGLTSEQIDKVKAWIPVLNSLDGIDGFFYNNFCPDSTPSRMYFTSTNAKLIDHIREVIDTESDKKVRDCLLYLTIEALSRVSNTAGTHGAFLKKFKERATDKLQLREELLVDGTVTAYSSDILALLTNPTFRKHTKEAVLYIDPPYNHRQYGPNYHLYETFVKNDSPTVTGKTGLRFEWQKESGSTFCSKKDCLTFIKTIVENTTAKYVFMSYSSDGLLTLHDIQTTFLDVVVHERDQRRYKADSSSDRTYSEKKLVEYLFEIKT